MEVQYINSIHNRRLNQLHNMLVLMMEIVEEVPKLSMYMY